MSERQGRGGPGRGGRAGWRRRYHRGGLARLGAVLVLVLLAALGGIGWIGSERAIHRACRAQPQALSRYPFAASAETVRFQSLDGTRLVGWFIPSGRPAAPTVILLHGYGLTRDQMLPHAAYLRQAGYNTLLFDFRACGESEGDAITVGVREPLDVRSAVSYVLSRADVDPERVAVQGTSLGAVAGILAMAEDPRIDALVAEGAFTDVEGTIARSFERFIGLPAFPFAPVTVFIAGLRVGASVNDVRPIDAMARLGDRPVFIIEDGHDTVVPPGSGRRLYEAASGAKQHWLIEEALHGAGWHLRPAEYEERVLAFYRQHLGP